MKGRPMAGRHTPRLRRGWFSAALALSLFTLAGRARAQDSPPPPGTSAENLAEMADAVSAPGPIPPPLNFAQPSYYPVPARYRLAPGS